MSQIWSSEQGRQAVHAAYMDMLRRWPVSSEQTHVPTGEGETFVIACGPSSAPPLILLQGSGGNAAMWLPEIARWAEHYRVYAIDVIGEPGLSSPSRPPLASEAYALWLDDVMNALNVGHAFFVGVSLGAWIALDYAIRRGGRVKKVVVISPSGIGRQKVVVILKAAGLMLLGRWGRRKAMAMVLGPIMGPPGPYDRDVGALAGLIARHFRYRRDRVPLFDESLQRLTMPVLAIIGAQDALLDSHGTKRLLERLVPSATIRWLPEAGHFVRNQFEVIHAFLKTG